MFIYCFLGNYGNKLDHSVSPSSSTTPPTNAIFDGCHYYYLPWGHTKPCISVDSHWEDIFFRLDPLNILLQLCERLVRYVYFFTDNNRAEVDFCGCNNILKPCMHIIYIYIYLFIYSFICLFVYGYPGRRHGKSEAKFRSKPRYVGNSCFAHRSLGPSDQGLQVSSIPCPSMHMSPPKLRIRHFKIYDGKPGRTK